MCGIFGGMWRQSDAVPAEDRLRATARLLRHRGPDGQGIFAAPGVGLVHTRLSLLDLSDRSNQPFWDDQQRWALVYNGEIYNFAALRAELAREGVAFRTTSDTEVLLQALLTWGPDVTLPKLEGMFAFGLYDRQEDTLLLARDRFGIKPLFIYETPEVVLFASEIAAMRPWMAFKPDLLSISSFLHGFAGPHRGHTFFEHVRFLDPGGVLRMQRHGAVRSGTFFSLAEFVDRDQQATLQGMSDRQRIDVVDAQLNDSVRAQLVADAPVGALCSGGVDSSLILAIAARYHNNLAIFHANVVGPLSEFDAASHLARHLKLDLQTVAVSDADFMDRIPQVIQHYGHPFYPNPHAIPFVMVAELVRTRQVKAVLTGEGADEAYLGYPWLAPDIRQWRRHVGPALKALLTNRPPASPGSRYWGPTWDAGVRPDGFGRHQQALVTALHNRFEVVGEAYAVRERLAAAGPISASAMKSLDLLHYNLRTLLHRNDTMGMAAGIESRFPFLDSAFVRLAVNMPYTAKIRFSPSYWDRRHYFFQDKWLLRQIAARYLPRALSHRPKRGFPVNAAGRMVIPDGFFDHSYLRELFGLSSSAMRLLIEQARQPLRVRLLQLEVWASIFLRDVPMSSVSQKLREHVQVAAA